MERLRGAFDSLLERLRGGPPEQALPMSRYRGQPSPVTPYQERKHQIVRSRRGQHGYYALMMILVMLVMVILLFWGLSSVIGGMGSNSSARTPTPASVPKPTAVVAATASPILPLAVLPTAAPGGIQPSPSPVTQPGLASPGPGTPDAGATRTYVVKAGDTPGQIARDNNISVDALMRANNITDPRHLRIGQQLTIPPANTPTSAPR
jgi:LysM repeat protein